LGKYSFEIVVWVLNMVFKIRVEYRLTVFQKHGAEEDFWAKVGGTNRTFEKIT
jgi:hypothetical protein